MKNCISLFILFVFGSIIVISCSSDSSDDLDPINPPNDTVTYANNVKSIIDGRCLNCHSNPPVNGAPIALTTFSTVKNETLNGNLLNRIEKTQGTAGVMPPIGSTLSAAQINIIKDWMSDGYLE